MGNQEVKIHYAVSGILAEFPEGGTKPIGNSQFIQAMRKIKTRHPNLFAGMVFSDNTSVPWSTQLEQILFCLGASGCLHRSPVDMCWYLHGLAEGFTSVFAKHFSPEELAILEQEGKALAEKIKNGDLPPGNNHHRTFPERLLTALLLDTSKGSVSILNLSKD